MRQQVARNQKHLLACALDQAFDQLVAAEGLINAGNRS
jgi:hypothetical protein